MDMITHEQFIRLNTWMVIARSNYHANEVES